jgi:hypothetical protein
VIGFADLIAVRVPGVETGVAGRLRPREVHRLIPPEPERRTAPVVPPTGAVAMDTGASSAAGQGPSPQPRGVVTPSTDPRRWLLPDAAARDGRWARNTGVTHRQERA